MNAVPVVVGATWEELHRAAAERIGSGREAAWMIEEVSGEPLGRAAGAPSEKARLRLESMVCRRAAGEPLQYVLGSWAFRRLELMVDRRVLIPRPETEQVVEVALGEMDRLGSGPGRGGDHGRGTKVTAVDLGTGSGAIALSLVRERTGVEVWATDRSAGALAVARANLAGLGGFAATRVRMVEGDWWDALPPELRGGVDLVVSNPPYIASAEMADLDPQVRDWEPRDALDAGPAGTEALDAILRAAPDWLRRPGAAVIEIAPHQADAAVDSARAAGFCQVAVRPDLAGRPRALVARLEGPSR